MGPIFSNLCTCATAPPQLGPGFAGSRFCHVMGYNIGSQYGRSRHRQRDPSGSSLDILCLTREYPLYRVRCPSQTAYYCLAGAKWTCECLTRAIFVLKVLLNKRYRHPAPYLYASHAVSEKTSCRKPGFPRVSFGGNSSRCIKTDAAKRARLLPQPPATHPRQHFAPPA
jgi:hypothetical protein